MGSAVLAVTIPGLILFGPLIYYSIYSLKHYNNCLVKLGPSMVSLYSLLGASYFLAMSLVSTERNCLQIFFSILLLLDLGLMVANFIISSAYLAIVQIKSPSCINSLTVKITDWITCGIGMSIIFILVCVLICQFIKNARRRIRYRQDRKEMESLFEIIYDSKFDI